MNDDERATPAEGLLTSIEAAQYAGVSRPTVTGWMTRNQHPTVPGNGRRYVQSADLAAIPTVTYVSAVVPAGRQDRQHAGKRLRALREAAGLGQLPVAAAGGLTQEATSRLERGQHDASAAAVRAMAPPPEWTRRGSGGETSSS